MLLINKIGDYTKRDQHKKINIGVLFYDECFASCCAIFPN